MDTVILDLTVIFKVLWKIIYDQMYDYLFKTRVEVHPLVCLTDTHLSVPGRVGLQEKWNFQLLNVQLICIMQKIYYTSLTI